MRYVIVGAGGQLGYAFLRLLEGEVLSLDREAADLRALPVWEARLREFRPDVLVNCAAYNQVDRAETDPDAAWQVNALGVRAAARWCAVTGTTFVHFSTNYVFGLDRQRRTPYREEDAPGPVSVYGTTKMAGECFARTECPRSLVIRTCGLFGPRPPGKEDANFVATMVRLARAGKRVQVVDDQVCTPTHVDDVVRGTLRLLERNCFGLYHLTAEGHCSWFEFARAIRRISRLADDIEPIDSATFGAPARRPAYGVLDCGLAATRTGVKGRTWEDGLEEYLALRRSEWLAG